MNHPVKKSDFKKIYGALDCMELAIGTKVYAVCLAKGIQGTHVASQFLHSTHF
jgi:hypothetical protein